MPAQRPVSQNSLVLYFTNDSEKGQTYRYKEDEPGKVIGGFYFSKVAMFFWRGGVAPKRLKVTIEVVDN